MTAYETAREAHNEAYAAYDVAVKLFRAGGSYEAFGEALAAKKIADEAFDEAHAIAADLPDEVEATEDNQIDMFA